ncbi:MAG: SAM-dependent methyltransferase [Defluviitaleaceae bacterium]|nr:SAM-dependent methyltransferase [Defluviitaleaceae bacterium]
MENKNLPVGTQDKIEPEIMLHSEYIHFFRQKGINFKAWGSAGPDFLFEQLGIIGEVKKEDSLSMLKAAIKEIFERKKQRFKISSQNAFFVICGDSIRYYTQVNKDYWQDVDLDDCVFFSGKYKDSFLDFISNRGNKIYVENHLSYALDLLLNEDFQMSITDGLQLLFNLNNDKRLHVNEGIFFNPGEGSKQRFIEIKCKKNRKKELLNFVNTFTVKDIGKVKEYVKHNYSRHLHDTKKANLGKYYTPKEIAETLKQEIEPKINNNTYILDLACGCGAFLELFDDCHAIGRDIDSQAMEILELFNFSNIGEDNTLLNVSRSKYGLSEADDVIIVGNPPYNDYSSRNRRYSTKAKSEPSPVDADIKSRDIGRSFLEAYAKLEPRYICVLHPLAYLIKPTSFRNLKYLRQSYRLENATIFKSHIFPDLKRRTPFPIVIATYKRDAGGMDFDYIQNFNFNIHNDTVKFRLSSVVQAGHDYIRQTVTSVDKNSSDIGLYHYNFRDINSLNKANFQNEEYRANHVDTMLVVNYIDLWKYCYVNCIKKFLIPMLVEDNNYILGNLNPILDKEVVESDEQYWRDLFIMCAILKNSHRIDCMCIENRTNNMLSKNFLFNDFRKRSRQSHHPVNIYKIFLDFADNPDEQKMEIIFGLINDYFRVLVKKCFK